MFSFPGFAVTTEHRGVPVQLAPLQPLAGLLPCPNPHCSRRFDRKSALASHVRNVHGGMPAAAPPGSVKLRGDADNTDAEDSDGTSEEEDGALARPPPQYAYSVML